MTLGPSIFAATTSASSDLCVSTMVRRCDLGLPGHGGVHHGPGVDLAVRMRVGRSGQRASVLEDQDVRHARLRLQHLRAGTPRGHDGDHLVVVEVGHRQGGVVVVTDHLGRACGLARPVHLVAGPRVRRVGREHRQVVAENVDAPVVRVRPVQPRAERCERIVDGGRRLVGGDVFSDPSDARRGAT